jgi:hypothetical protein
MALEPGSLLNDRYRIEAVLAKGGMGAIYRAFDVTLNISVAVKENFLTSEQFARQFRREASLLAGMRHPNLPRVTDHFSMEGSGQYLVMDYIDGDDLRQLLASRGPLPEAQVLQIGAAVCDALEYLHSRQPAIVHRDVKPGNVKITPTGEVYLVDFGLAKIAESGQATTTGAQALTPGYAPPEQYGQGTDLRSDLYSLGATLYAALTGKIPEDGLARAMGSAQLTPIRKYAPAVSERTARAIEKAMEVLPAERYATAAEFRSALVGSAASSGRSTISARPGIESGTAASGASPTVARTRQGEAGMDAGSQPVGRRTPWGLIAAGVVGIVVVGGIILALVFGGLGKQAAAVVETTAAPLLATATPEPVATESPEPSATQAPTETPAPTETVIPTETSVPTTAVTPLGGARGEIAFVSERSGLPQIWIMDTAGSSLRQITNLPDGACQPDWSPDGERLVFISPCKGKRDTYPGSSMFIMNADGKGLQPLISLPGGDFDPAWSPDGENIAFTSLRDGQIHIFLYQLSTNSVVRLSPASTFERRPAWSPDGLELAYETSRQGSKQVWIMQADGSKAREFSPVARGIASSPDWAPDNSVIAFNLGSTLPLLAARQVGVNSADIFFVSDQIAAVEDARFSSDSFWFVFSTKRDENEDLFVMMRNGGSFTRLTDDPAPDYHPVWRP